MEPCTHTKTEIRWRTISGGAKILQRQCLSCGEPVGSAISQKDKSPELLGSFVFWDEDLVARERAKAAEQRATSIASMDEQRAQRSAEWKAWYSEYLQTPQWKAKRQAVLKRDHFICQGCLTQRAIEVHHLTYAHVGDELLFELTSLCGECHGKAHTTSRRGPPPSIQ